MNQLTLDIRSPYRYVMYFHGDSVNRNYTDNSLFSMEIQSLIMTKEVSPFYTKGKFSVEVCEVKDPSKMAFYNLVSTEYCQDIFSCINSILTRHKAIKKDEAFQVNFMWFGSNQSVIVNSPTTERFNRNLELKITQAKKELA